MKRAWGAWLLFAVLPAAAGAAEDSCVDCHSALPAGLGGPVASYEDDVHRRHGFSCADCHGGDRTSYNPDVSMSPARGFIGKPARTAVPRLCARCHSDATLMHKYAPQQRVDQYTQYMTSVHGQLIAAGDAAAAVCIDCHGVHGIRSVKDALAPVHPLRLPRTCARCHADPQHMAKYKIPTNQLDDYLKSVHWEALEKRGDLSAPGCASCHGNHGATPPGVGSVAAVCGTCHVLMEDLYAKSPHQPVFAGMGIGGCVVCHDNHAVLRTSSRMLSGPDAVCSQCHEAASAGGLAATRMAGLIRNLDAALEKSETILKQASSAGMEVSEALLRQNDAREAQVKARVAVHAFEVGAVQKPVSEGLQIAAETYRAGEAALQERQRRRVGLGFSLVTILITLAALWLVIRRLERSQS